MSDFAGSLHLAHEQYQRARRPPAETQQKISGRLASDDVTQDRLDIRSYIDTARKHGKNAMDVLHDLMLGRPWRPPAQAFSRNLSRNPGYLSPCVNGLNAYDRKSAASPSYSIIIGQLHAQLDA